MKLIKILRISKFTLKNWLNVFTDFNAKKDKNTMMNLIKIYVTFQ